MPPTKSPGPDGMPGLFFQKYWDIVGEEITEAALLVLNNEGDIHQWNQTLITLIPKIQSPTQVSEFRPISLCNVVYKLVSRTITNRFSRILDEVIGDQQSAFVPGRLITDNVLLGFKTMHWLRQHRGGNTGYATLKLDMSKSYDRVEWPFLEGIMLRLGFAESWVNLIFCKAKLSEATHLKSCITSNVKASGKLINFDKSALSFSLNTRSNDKITICSVFGVNQVQSHELYLGLSTFSMKNKRIQFGYIRDRVIRKLQGWKERTFSQGGKEVLLKSVVQSIPTYTMSCFILPDSLVKDIKAACACFWWGSSADHKKVHWKKWIDLCRPKSEGGLGFRNLAHFNQALLGKQVWRFIQRPNSLLSRVFKAKYFHSSTIWHASANSKVSYVWKSILWGRNLVARGIRWRVGDGRSISVYNSRWIPTPHSFLVSSLRTLPADSLISSLWNYLWQSTIPPKIKIFWWRALHNIIPTSWNLKVHHVPAELKCSLCGSGIETTVHSLFLCPKMKLLWKKSGMVDCLSAAKTGNMVDVAFWAKDHLSSDQFELFAMYTWEIWNLRNLWTHGKEAVITGKELCWIPEYISSFKACRATAHNLPSSPQPSYGLGAVIRDSAGSLIVAGVWLGQQASSVGLAELMAVKAGLQMAKEYGLSSLIVYCDAVNGVAKLQRNALPANEDGIVISDIKQLASTLNVVFFNYFSRICNGVAHCLARNALHMLSSEYWFDDTQPSWLVSVLLADFCAS
ncbi:hypothetical protein UlMin_028003 [Ulmus minor]